MPAFFARTTSRQIVSEATYEPPGLETRKRIAATFVVLDRRPDRLRHRLRAHRLPARERVAAALAADDAADAVDEGDRPLPLGVGPPLLLQVGREAEELRVRAPLLHQLLVDLVAVGEAVDEPGLEGLRAEVGAAVDDRAHLVLGHLPPLGDPLHHLPVDRIEKRLRRLPVGVGELRLGVLVHRVLELVPLAELGLDAELVESAAEERALGDEAVQAEVAGGLEPDLVEGGREVVGAVPRRELAERLRVGDRELLLRPEGLHGVADLLDLGDADRRGAEARDEADDVRVVPRLLERVDDVAKRERPLAPEDGEGVVGRRLGDPALEVELEDRLLRHGGRALAGSGGRRPRRGRRRRRR